MKKVVFLFLASLILFGCPKGAKVTVEATNDSAVVTVTQPQTQPVQNHGVKPPAIVHEESKPKTIGVVQSIYFDFDSSVIKDSESMSMLTAQKVITSEAKKVRLEGNCDKRGSDQYNMLLGLDRATSVRNVLDAYGIDVQISAISNGKGKPVCNEATENCYQRNRRVDIIIEE